MKRRTLKKHRSRTLREARRNSKRTRDWHFRATIVGRLRAIRTERAHMNWDHGQLRIRTLA